MWIETNKISSDGTIDEFYVRCEICGNVISSKRLFSSDKTHCCKCGAYHKGIRYATHKVIIEE